MTSYDIYFDPRISKWKVRMVYHHYWLWTTTKDLTGVVPEEDKDLGPQPLVFGDFEAAERYTIDVGLAYAYLRRHPSKKVTYAEAMLNANTPSEDGYSQGGVVPNRNEFRDGGYPLRRRVEGVVAASHREPS